MRQQTCFVYLVEYIGYNYSIETLHWDTLILTSGKVLRLLVTSKAKGLLLQLQELFCFWNARRWTILPRISVIKIRIRSQQKPSRGRSRRVTNLEQVWSYILQRKGVHLSKGITSEADSHINWLTKSSQYRARNRLYLLAISVGFHHEYIGCAKELVLLAKGGRDSVAFLLKPRTH